ncbi:MAG TPA: LysR family transcriptional regulator [Gammaproteobacteria bacterium]|jgi:DNA-binding transcriptional LysR family regulator|nr:LysR family transcriptional regulator [Gammaproteobacteria bacterium]
MNLRQFDLNLLVALDVLLTERNVTRAGERLYLSQPAMSGILARLRHAFHDELLVRVGRNLEPTALALELAGPVRECVQQIEDLLNLRRPFEPASARWSFRIAASDYVVFLVLGPLLKALTARAPNVSVRFYALEPAAAEKLAAGELDFAVLPAQIEEHLPSAPLFEDSWICAVWSGHPHTRDRFTLEEFLAFPHLSFRFAGPDHGSVAESYLEQMGCERRIVASTESFATAPFLLRETPLVTLVPRRLGERLREAAGIRLVEPPFEVPPLREKLIWSPRFTASAPHAWLRAQLGEVAAAL